MSDGRPTAPTVPTAPQEEEIEAGGGQRAPGPPGSGVFSLEGRQAAGLYLIAWLLSGAGLAAAFVGMLTEPPVAGILVLAGLLLLGLGLSTAAGYQLLARSGRPPAAYRGPSPLIVFGVLFTLTNAVGIALLAIGLGDVATTGGFLLGTGLLFVGYLITVWLFAVRSGALTWPEMGLPTTGRLQRPAADLGFGVAVMIPVTLIALIVGGFVAQLVDARPPQVVPIPAEPLALAAVFVAAAIAIPIGEELFFRGFALTAWLRDVGPRSALVRSAVFFALVHIANITASGFVEGAKQALVQSVVILPLGFVLGWLFLQRGLWAPIAAHITYNGLVLMLASVAQRVVAPPA